MSGAPMFLFPSLEGCPKGGVCRIMAKNTPLNPLSRGDFEGCHGWGLQSDSDVDLQTTFKSFRGVLS